jgi:hypothetical protein
MSEPTRQEQLDRVADFQRDIQRFHELLSDGKANETQPSDFDQLRQSLLHRLGPIRALFARHLPHAQPPDLWTRAIYDPAIFYVRRLADYLTELIGLIENDPSILSEPPQSHSPVAPLGPIAQINVHGGNVNIAQTGTGGVSQLTRQPDLTGRSEESTTVDDRSRLTHTASWDDLCREDLRHSSTQYARTQFPLIYTHAGIEARAENGAVVKGDSLVVCLQDQEHRKSGLAVWLTMQNRGEKACRWFGGTLTAYATPKYENISPAPNSFGGHWLVDLFPGEQFSCYYFFPFAPNVRAPKYLTCRSWDKELTYWWARGA